MDPTHSKSDQKQMEFQKKRLTKLEEEGSKGYLRLEKPRNVQKRMDELCTTMAPIFPDTLQSLSDSEQTEGGQTHNWLARLWFAPVYWISGESRMGSKPKGREHLPSWPILVPLQKDLKKAWWDRYEKVCEQTKHIKADTKKMEDGIAQYTDRIPKLPDRLKRAVRIESIESKELRTPSVLPNATRMSLWAQILEFLGLRSRQAVFKPTMHVTELEKVLNEELVDLKPFDTRLVRDSDNLNSQYEAMLKNIEKLEGAL